MLNRKETPAFKTIDKIDIIKAKKEKLNNGIDLFTINAGSQEITKIEFVFKAGMFYQPSPLIASNTNTLIETGTKSYGSFLELEVGQDFAGVTLYSLNKYVEKSLKYVEEILKYPTFPEDEFKIHIANKKQKHQINSQKVNVVARRKFSELIFGQKHPYGIQVTENDFETANIEQLKTFFNNHYNSNNCTIFASGNLPKDIITTLNNFFGNNNWGDCNGEVLKNNKLINTIKVGRLLFNKTHQDYFKFQVLNTILGGYFGSRLMANIREDKGYTYGIGSGLASFVNGGYFAISTEVGADVTKQTLNEIYIEIAALRNNLVSDTELETVRNYILGNFLRTVDGSFALADKFKAIWEFGLDYSYYENYFNAVKTVTAFELRDLANKYLNEDDLIECVVGKM